MENTLMQVIHLPVPALTEVEDRSSTSSFIEANTLPVSLRELREDHIIPVFVKDNEPLISQFDLIEITQDAVSRHYRGEQILSPQIRVSHPIKGRIPDAKDKPANQLEEWEKTLYYERMMFCIDIPSIYDTVDGNMLTLQVGGVKAYNLDNLYNRKGSAEHFKLFIGFQNRVCTNLCIQTDGYLSDVKVHSLDQLRTVIHGLLHTYDMRQHLGRLESLTHHTLTEKQFAILLGRCRMYHHLPPAIKKDIPPLLYGDMQLGSVCKDYFRDTNFCRHDNGDINLWKFYNLFTGANKTTYIDQFLDRSVNALDFAQQIQAGLNGHNTNWYLN